MQPITGQSQQIGKTYSAEQQTQTALSALSPSARAVMDRLSRMGSLPAGEFEYHGGPITNGQDPKLDDASWRTVQLPFSASSDEIWIRKWIELPPKVDAYDLTGSRIWLQGPTRGEATLYRNGERIAAGPDMEPIVLVDSAKPGDRVLLAIHIGKTAAAKNLRAAELHLDYAPNRPRPANLYAEFLSAALLVPSMAPGDASAKLQVEQAITTVDLPALQSGDQAQFDASLREAGAKLAKLDPLEQGATFHLTGNSHIDAAWLWPWTETVDVVHRTFGTAAQLMDEYPDYTFTQSAAQYNVWMADKYPSLNDRIRQRIREGRWEIVGGMWVEPDLNLPDRESLVRQLLIGKRAFQQLCGVDVRIGWNPDSFGYNWQLLQICQKSGVDYFVTQKMSWNETNQLPLKLFWWQAPDGSKVLTYFPDGYGNTNLDPVRLSTTWPMPGSSRQV